MISKETIIALARRYQTSEFPNIVREYFQHCHSVKRKEIFMIYIFCYVKEC